jgi:hypothetical protein
MLERTDQEIVYHQTNKRCRQHKNYRFQEQFSEDLKLSRAQGHFQSELG